MRVNIIKILYVFLIINLVACSESANSPYTEKYITAAIDPVYSNIENPKERWDAYQLEDSGQYPMKPMCL